MNYYLIISSRYKAQKEGWQLIVTMGNSIKLQNMHSHAQQLFRDWAGAAV